MGGAFDQARDVRHHELAVGVDLHNAEVGRFGGEWIVGNFGPSARHPAQQSALAGVRFAQEADVSDHFQLEGEPPLFALFAKRELARGLVLRAFESHVPFAPLAAVGDDHLVAIVNQIAHGEVVIRIQYHRAGGDVNRQVVGVRAMSAGAGTVGAARCAPVFAMGEFGKAIYAVPRNDDHTAAIAAITPIRPAPRDVLLTPEAEAAIAPLSCAHIDGDTINEHGWLVAIGQCLGSRNTCASQSTTDH